MIDIHTHLLPDIDDGSQSWEESLELLKNAHDDGISDIIVTPHYDIGGYYHKSRNEIIELINSLKEKASDIDVNIYPGNEIYIDKGIIDELKEGKISCLGNSNYVLIEFPFTYYEGYYDDILYDIKNAGYQIIIAHPERYSYVKEDIEFVNRWIKEGYKLQCNASSLKHHQRTMDKLLSNKLVSYIASDGHNIRRPILLKEAYDFVSNKYEKQYADELFEINARIILDNMVK